MTMRSLKYADGEPVEKGDVVTAFPFGRREMFDREKGRMVEDGDCDGVVLRMHPRSGEVGVRVEDHRDMTRSGTPRRKTFRLPVDLVDLVRRDDA
jgi:hypothetical protein